MRLSEERVSHLSHRILKALMAGNLIEPTQSEEKLYREIKRSMISVLHEEDELDAVVCRKIRSLSRTVPEGSAEWTVLYRKYMDQEMLRRKRP